jgi:superfamily I DNA and/or RNA helicase
LATQKKEKGDLNNCKKKILKESQLVFTTLSSAASGVIQSSEIEFDTVVID